MTNEINELLKDIRLGLVKTVRALKLGQYESKIQHKALNEKLDKIDQTESSKKQLELLEKISKKDSFTVKVANPIKQVEVTNDVKLDKTSISALSKSITKAFTDVALLLVKAIKATKVTWPKSSKDYISVRLTDGHDWYESKPRSGGGGSQERIKIWDKTPVDESAYNPSTVISYNAAGEAVRIDETFEGVTYRTTITRADNTIASSITIGAATQQ